MNVFVISGRLGAKPILKKLTSGAKVCSFRLAHSRQPENGESPEGGHSTDWYECEIWGEAAEIISIEAVRGQVITVTGRLVMRRYFSDTKGHEVLVPTIRDISGFELGRLPRMKEGDDQKG